MGKTYSGVELVHFYANTATDEIWKRFDLPQARGAVVFWQFVFPIIMKVREYVGCEYVFLFAADDSKELTLEEYYHIFMGFADEGEMSTAKTLYDLSCRFMYQSTATLAHRREEFFGELRKSSAMPNVFEYCRDAGALTHVKCEK